MDLLQQIDSHAAGMPFLSQKDLGEISPRRQLTKARGGRMEKSGTCRRGSSAAFPPPRSISPAPALPLRAPENARRPAASAHRDRPICSLLATSVSSPVDDTIPRQPSRETVRQFYPETPTHAALNDGKFITPDHTHCPGQVLQLLAGTPLPRSPNPWFQCKGRREKFRPHHRSPPEAAGQFNLIGENLRRLTRARRQFLTGRYRIVSRSLFPGCHRAFATLYLLHLVGMEGRIVPDRDIRLCLPGIARKPIRRF